MIGTNLLRSLPSPLATPGGLFLPRCLQAPPLACVLLVLSIATWNVAADSPHSNQHSPATTSQLVQGNVTAIVDGDTLHLTADGIVYIVDLAGIDAPEKGQPSGDMAAQVLHLKIMQKPAQLLVLPHLATSPNVQPITPAPAESAPPDRQPARTRVRGILYSDGCVNSQLVREGIAWHDPTGCPSATLARSQESARNARRGLWQSEQEPIAPWQWRQEQSKIAGTIPVTGGQPVKDLSRFFEASTPPAVIEAAVQTPSAPTAPSATSPPVSAASGDRWLTASSGVRHNSTCRYYKKSKGRPCTANEGQPCKKCGG